METEPAVVDGRVADELRVRMRARLAMPNSRLPDVGVVTIVAPEPGPEPAVAATAPAAPNAAVVENQVIADLFHTAVPPAEVPSLPAVLGPALSPTIHLASQRTPIRAPSPSSLLAVPAEAVAGKTGRETGGKKAMPRSYGGKRRHPIRSFLTFVVVVGLLGGAAYAGWYKFLHHSATWSKDLQPSAQFVEDTLHRSFDETVHVVTLPVADYEARLAVEVLARTYADPTVQSDFSTGAAAAAGVATGTATTPAIGTSLALRAVGLVVGQTPLASIGHIVAASITSFYANSDRTIYRLDGSTALFQVGMIRAMTAALIDQDIDYTAKLAEMNDAQRVGLQAIIDGIANQVVAAKFSGTLDLEVSMNVELTARLSGPAVGDVGTPLYLYSVLSSSEIGATDVIGAPVDKPLQGLALPSSDGPVFDPGRSDLAVVAGAVPTRTLGMEFWFEALVPTLGVDAARDAALLWSTDTSATSLLDTRACINATITTSTVENQAALLAVLTTWAGSRPETSVATATTASDRGVTVSMCEPVDAMETPSAPRDEISVLFVEANTERLVLKRVSALGLPETAGARACAVAAYRAGAINSFAPTSSDPVLVGEMNNVVAFCRSA